MGNAELKTKVSGTLVTSAGIISTVTVMSGNGNGFRKLFGSMITVSGDELCNSLLSLVICGTSGLSMGTLQVSGIVTVVSGEPICSLVESGMTELEGVTCTSFNDSRRNVAGSVDCTKGSLPIIGSGTALEAAGGEIV